MTRARVIIAEDHEPMQDVIRRLVESEFDIVIVSDGRAAIEAVSSSPPDVILMDIAMPVMNGIAAAKLLRASHPDLKIVFVSAYADQAYIDEAFRLGAHGYVLKNSLSRDLSLALRMVMAGEIFRPVAAARR